MKKWKPSDLSRSMVSRLLRGERNLSLKKAKIMAELTGSDIMVWIDPNNKEKRVEAWGRL
jgi:transcriptional regulator with XRE-family HTH domain